MNYDGNFDLGFDGEWIGLFQFALAAQYLLQRAAVQKYPRKTFAKSFWIMYNIFCNVQRCKIIQEEHLPKHLHLIYDIRCNGAKLSKNNICAIILGHIQDGETSALDTSIADMSWYFLMVPGRPQRSIETIASFDQWSGTIENH